MGRKIIPNLILMTFVLSGCMFFPVTPAKVNGSGNVVTESREISGITSISLEGSANVNVQFGLNESLTITGEDNIISLIETNVKNHQLTIKTKPLMTYSATKPVQIHVTVTSLKGISISGSGNIDVSGYSGDALAVALPGSGNISLVGSANDIRLDLGGSGNIMADQLKAKTATVVLSGSGNIKVYASDSLKANISGSGDIQYQGNPSKIDKVVTGSGNIHG